MGQRGDPVSKADLADRHRRPSRARPHRGHRSSLPVLQSRVPAHLLRRSRAGFRDVMQQGTRDRADRHHAPAGLGELHTGTWLKLKLDSTVSMASTVPMVSHAPLVSLTSSITRAHGSPHRPGHSRDGPDASSGALYPGIRQSSELRIAPRESFDWRARRAHAAARELAIGFKSG